MKALKSVVTLLKYEKFTKLTIVCEIPNSMPIPVLIEKMTADYPGYTIVSIEQYNKQTSESEDVSKITPTDAVPAKAKHRAYVFAVITDGQTVLCEEKNGLLHLIGGGVEKGETCRSAIYREMSEELRATQQFRNNLGGYSKAENSNWASIFHYLDTRVVSHNNIQYIESCGLMHCDKENLNLACIAPNENQILRFVPFDRDYLNDLQIGVECDDSFYWAISMALWSKNK